MTYMATRPKRRMKYPPGSANLAAVDYVLEAIQPAGACDGGKWLRGVQLRNHAAVDELTKGRGTRDALTTVLQMHNMTRALLLNGFGIDLSGVVLASDAAIKAIIGRVQTTRSYTLYASEILALRDLMALHDAQMDVATVRDVNDARNDALNDFKGGNFTRMSTKFLGDPP